MLYQYIVVILPYLIFDEVLALPEFTRLENYTVSASMNTTETCLLPPKECITLCIYSSNCSAIILEGNLERCETVKLIYYGRVVLEAKNMSSAWVKSMHGILGLGIVYSRGHNSFGWVRVKYINNAYII